MMVSRQQHRIRCFRKGLEPRSVRKTTHSFPHGARGDTAGTLARWVLSACVVVGLHAGAVWAALRWQDARAAAGSAPPAVLIDLAPIAAPEPPDEAPPQPAEAPPPEPRCRRPSPGSTSGGPATAGACARAEPTGAGSPGADSARASLARTSLARGACLRSAAGASRAAAGDRSGGGRCTAAAAARKDPAPRERRKPPAPARPIRAPAPGEPGGAGGAFRRHGPRGRSRAPRRAGPVEEQRRQPHPPIRHGALGRTVGQCPSSTFSFDRSGRILSAQVARSSGQEALDQQALRNVRSASPIPAPPADQASLTLTVPIQFNIR